MCPTKARGRRSTTSSPARSRPGRTTSPASRRTSAPESFAASGIADFEVTAWYALCGPPGIPADVLNRLHGAVVKGVGSPEMQKVLGNIGAIPVAGSPAELDAFVRAEVARWSRVAKAGNITLD
jgi:tripartite-type tricarboxylate transporter receptor subunit TctC